MTATHDDARRNSRRAGVSGEGVTRSLLIGALALALLAPAAADGASRLVIRGAGFGHGVGMSQYGAYGLAKRGSDHAFILAHYYRGTQLGRLDGSAQTRVLLKTASRIVVRNAASVAGGRRLSRTRRYVATRGLSGTVTLRSASGRRIGTYRSPLTLTGAGGGIQLLGSSANAVRDGHYRGVLQIRSAAIGGLAAINAVGLDDYVRGVVAREMPAGWPQEALRAQAVAARTYALATRKDVAGFDHYADTRSQVYDGMSAETAATDEAVAQTRGKVVAYKGKPVITYFFSTSGGRTEDVQNSFLGAEPAPYLTSVDDPFDSLSPRHRWTRRMSLRTAQRRLGSLVRGSLRRIRVLRRGSSPRVVRAQIVGSRGKRIASGPTLRRKLGLYDTWARFTVITASATRGDGNTPRTPASPAPPSGGTAPQLARGAAVSRRPARPSIGRIRGRIDPVLSTRRTVTIERRVGRRWKAAHEVALAARGRYTAQIGRPGRYRVVYGRDVGPSVSVRTPR